ncbi:cupin domain-containing protein [Viridibacterium curvum]|uniref:Cupin domain-containing protein n=1 Tax=Viridibacterium curvum TaxID=1101404 RepID=A0ABP9QAD3_9RHOO
MIFRHNDMHVEHKTGIHDGQGEVSLRYLIERNTHPNLRLLTWMHVAPGASVGLHHHRLETEYYLLLKGAVRVNDNGSISDMHAGDLLQTASGQGHALENIGDETADLLVFVVTHAEHPLNTRSSV